MGNGVSKKVNDVNAAGASISKSGAPLETFPILKTLNYRKKVATL